MNIDILRKEITRDEGVEYIVYLDHLGLPTFGIGHLIKESDPEYGKPAGTPVSTERVNSCFETDIQTVLDECNKLYDDFYELPEEVQHIIANMMFNMGYPRLSKFKGIGKQVLILVTGIKLQTRWLTAVGIPKLLTEQKD